MYGGINKIKGAILALAAIAAVYSPAPAQTILTMDRALDIAADNSPSLRTSFLNMERSQENLNAQRASLKSQFSLNLTPVSYNQSRQFDSRYSEWYTNKSFSTNGTFRVDQPILWTDGTLSLTNTFGWQDSKSERAGNDNENKAFSNTLRVQLLQPLFTYNTTKMALKKLEFSYENSLISYALQRMRTEQSITTQFYSVYTNQERLYIAKTQLENARQNFELIKSKVDIDLLPKSELYQAEINYATAQSNLDDRVVSLENAKDQLKQTIGMDINEDIMVTIGNVEFARVDVDVEEAVDHALRTRLELRQREITNEELEFAMIEVKARNEFKGNLNLSMGLMGDNEKFKDVYRNPTQNPSVAVTFQVPIFDWGEKKARIRSQQLTAEVSKIDEVEERKSIEINIRQTYRSLENLVSQVSISEQKQKNAQLTYDLNTIKYRDGDITGMQMSQFEEQLTSAKMDYISTIINYKTELLNMRVLTLYDYEKGVSAVPDLTAIENTMKAKKNQNKSKK